VRADIEGITHLVRDTEVDEEFLQLLRAHPGVFVTPNPGVTSRAMDPGRCGSPKKQTDHPSGKTLRIWFEYRLVLGLGYIKQWRVPSSFRRFLRFRRHLRNEPPLLNANRQSASNILHTSDIVFFAHFVDNAAHT
jgi:hypothetical protein